MTFLEDEMLKVVHVGISRAQTERQGRQESELCFILMCAPELASEAAGRTAATKQWTGTGSLDRRLTSHCSNLRLSEGSSERDTERVNAGVLIGFGSCERFYMLLLLYGFVN